MNCTDYPQEEIDQKLKHALELLRQNDSHLLKEDVNERSITHMLATYLRQEFQDWDVDCEYNRDGHYSKKILTNICPPCPSTTKSDDSTGRTVYPDIIIHHRGKTENLVVIEVKKSTNSIGSECDKAKLSAYKRELDYCYAIFLELKIGSDYNNPTTQDYYSLITI